MSRTILTALLTVVMVSLTMSATCFGQAFGTIDSYHQYVNGGAATIYNGGNTIKLAAKATGTDVGGSYGYYFSLEVKIYNGDTGMLVNSEDDDEYRVLNGKVNLETSVEVTVPTTNTPSHYTCLVTLWIYDECGNLEITHANPMNFTVPPPCP